MSSIATMTLKILICLCQDCIEQVYYCICCIRQIYSILLMAFTQNKIGVCLNLMRISIFTYLSANSGVSYKCNNLIMDYVDIHYQFVYLGGCICKNLFALPRDQVLLRNFILYDHQDTRIESVFQMAVRLF